MTSRSGSKPAVGAVLLCALTWFSIAAWQDDLANDDRLQSQAAFNDAFVMPKLNFVSPSKTQPLTNRAIQTEPVVQTKVVAPTQDFARTVSVPVASNVSFGPIESRNLEAHPDDPVALHASESVEIAAEDSDWDEIQSGGFVAEGDVDSEFSSGPTENRPAENRPTENESTGTTEQFISTHQESWLDDQGDESSRNPVGFGEQTPEIMGELAVVSNEEWPGLDQPNHADPELAAKDGWQEESFESDSSSEPEPPVAIDLNQRPSEVPSESPETAVTEAESAGDDEPRKKISVRLTDQDAGPANPAAKWPAPTSIYNQLDELDQIELTKNWSQRTRRILEELEKTEIKDSMSVGLLKQVGLQHADLTPLIIYGSKVPVQHAVHAQGKLATDLRRLSYRLERRMRVWTMVCQLAKQDLHKLADLNRGYAGNIRTVSNARLNFEAIHPQWHDYLRLDALEQSFNALNPKSGSPAKKRETARETLARIYSPSHSREQRQYARNVLDPQLVRYLKESAADRNFEFSELLDEIEKHEGSVSGLTSFRLNDMYQNLVWSEDPTSQALAEALEADYRNANFRIAISARLINRLIPQLPSSQEPVSENLMGAQVNGQLQIDNRIQVSLIPDPNRIHLNVVTLGSVHSQTQAQKSGVTVENEGASRFQVFKQLAIGRTGVSSRYPIAFSQSKNRVVSLRSNLDSVPVLGWVARKIAKKKIAEAAPATEQYTKQKIERQASEKVQQEVESKLAYARQYLNQNLIQPLVAMDLEPEAIQMATTAERITTRYRVAGRDQMAANTARPRALQGSLLSMQMHDSMINNLLMRIELNDKKFSTEELISHLQKVMGREQKALPPMDNEVQFEFATHDPIRLDFEEGKIRVQMNLKSLQVNDGKRWKNVSVSTRYIAYIRGMELILVKDEDAGLQLAGRRLRIRDKVAIGTIFKSIYKEQFQMSALPQKINSLANRQNLKIAQFVVTNGWIGLSINETPAGAPHYQQQTQAIHSRRAQSLNFSDQRR